jgi:hypothetical protein
MEWLFRPKVQLGLLVNFAFVMFTLASSSTGARRQRVVVDVRRGFDAVESSSSAAGAADDTSSYVPLPSRFGPSQALAYHYPEAGQIIVSTTHDLTLVRKDGRMLTLWPSFYVNGNSINPPRKVLLPFTSSAPARNYADECELEIGTEAGMIFWGTLPVSHDRLSKGRAQGVVERMGQEIPYSVFVKLVTSKRVTLKVGDEEITLTDEQLSALRDMQRCIQDGACG